MSLANKHKQWVLDTVDRLRQRKARPDLERISRMVERFHGLTHAETKESLDKLCDEGVIIKVHFKGNISYRHIRNNDKETDGQNPLYNTSSRIVTAIKTIMKQTGDGVCFDDLEKWLISKNPDTRLVKLRLFTALEKEIDRGYVTKLPDNCYVLTESLPKHSTVPPRCGMKPRIQTEKSPQPAAEKKSVEPAAKTGSDARPREKISKHSAPLSDKSMSAQVVHKSSDVKEKKVKSVPSTPEKNQQTPVKTKEDSPTKEQLRRGRPLSKRKRFKKTHGPDFENPLELKKGTGREKEDGVLDTCDFCSLSALSNPLGLEENLLICKECNAKAHPSCMDYSPELAQRALNSPWQCMECKMCEVCGLDGLENSELMLFCDACDKGYHMTCHQPPIYTKPKGKWVCSECKKDTNPDASSEKAETSLKEEEPRIPKKRGRKRKISSPTTPLTVKCPKSEGDVVNGSLSESAGAGGSNGAACLPTPSASPRPSDTFDYEMKMSLAGLTFPMTEDSTVYSDATDWSIEEVARFFEECGFKVEAESFTEQEIDGKSLLLLRREDVLTGLGLKLGPAVKIYKKIARLQQCSQASLYS